MNRNPRRFSRSLLLVALVATGLAMLAGEASAHGGPAYHYHGGVYAPGWWWYDPAWSPGPWYGEGEPVRLPQSRTAALDLDISPEDAEVLLDGQPIGIADDFDGFPDYLYLRPGHYQLEFRIPGYQSFRTDLEVEAGRMYSFDTSLELEPGKRRLRAGWGEATPPHATRNLFAPAGQSVDDDEDLGEDDSAARGGRSDEADDDSDDDDQPLRTPERVRERETPSEDAVAPPAPVPVTPLRKGYGRIVLEVEPADATVWLDGAPLGAAPSFGGVIEANEGKHELVVMKAGHETRVLRVEVEDGENENVVVSLSESSRTTRAPPPTARRTDDPAGHPPSESLPEPGTNRPILTMQTRSIP